MILKEKFEILEKAIQISAPEYNYHLGKLKYLNALARGRKEVLYALLKYVPLESLGFKYCNIEQYSVCLKNFDECLYEELKPLILAMKRAILKNRPLIYYLCGHNKFLSLIKDILDHQTETLNWINKHKNLASRACKYRKVKVLKLLFDFEINMTSEILAKTVTITALHKFKHNHPQKLHVWYLSESELSKREKAVNDVINYYTENNYNYNKKPTFENS